MTDASYFDTPDWVAEILAAAPRTPEGLMRAAIQTATGSAERRGGPFGALLADTEGRIIEVGWNQVVTRHDSTCHAEVHCLRRAQHKLKRHDLENCSPSLELYSSTSPCIQCYGAIYWSGVRKVYAAARSSDAQQWGFDEGPISDELWQTAFERKGIVLVRDFCRDDALETFERFHCCQGVLY